MLMDMTNDADDRKIVTSMLLRSWFDDHVGDQLSSWPSVKYRSKCLYIICAVFNVSLNVAEPSPVSDMFCQRYLNQCGSILHYKVVCLQVTCITGLTRVSHTTAVSLWTLLSPEYSKPLLLFQGHCCFPSSINIRTSSWHFLDYELVQKCISFLLQDGM